MATVVLADIHFKMLWALAYYYTLSREQLQQLCQNPGVDPTGRAMRKHIAKLLHAGLISECQGEVVFRKKGAPVKIYHLRRHGAETLAAHMNDERWLACCTDTPNWQKLKHWKKIADLRIAFDLAVERQSDGVEMTDWLTEWQVANPYEKEPHLRYSLYTVLQDSPRVVCNPDASCVVTYRDRKKGLYFEIDRETSGVAQIAASKHSYGRMYAMGMHTRHFPGVKPETPFSVIHVSEGVGRRDLVCGAVAARQKEVARLWKFAAFAELTAETALFEPILRDAEGSALPLIQRVKAEGGAK